MSENRNGIYINGKEQAQEILKLLTPAERNRILASINQKNPSLASELKKNSMSTKDIEEYPIDCFIKIFNTLKPEILGLALKNTNTDFQKNVLRAAPRLYAEKTFKTLMLNIPTSKRETILRAKKITVTELSHVAQLS